MRPACHVVRPARGCLQGAGAQASSPPNDRGIPKGTLMCCRRTVGRTTTLVVRGARPPTPPMPLFRLSLSTLSRRQGRSAVAAAAYRAGVVLEDERTAERHDYRRRTGVVRTALIGWAGARAALWNAAEAAERRRDSVTARELQVALPHELPRRGQWALVVQLAEWLRARYGVAVDLALHAPSVRGDVRNWHAHLLFTTRAVDADGRIGAITATLDRRLTGSAEVETMRATWAGWLNVALARAGHPAGVDHRAYHRRGMTTEPGHLTRGAQELERRGIATDRGEAVRARRRRNASRGAGSPAELPASSAAPGQRHAPVRRR